MRNYNLYKIHDSTKRTLSGHTYTRAPFYDTRMVCLHTKRLRLRGVGWTYEGTKGSQAEKKKVGSERMKQIFSTSAQMAISADLLCAFN